jgi:hypothetical protein
VEVTDTLPAEVKPLKKSAPEILLPILEAKGVVNAVEPLTHKIQAKSSQNNQAKKRSEVQRVYVPDRALETPAAVTGQVVEPTQTDIIIQTEQVSKSVNIESTPLAHNLSSEFYINEQTFSSVVFSEVDTRENNDQVFDLISPDVKELKIINWEEPIYQIDHIEQQDVQEVKIEEQLPVLADILSVIQNDSVESNESLEISEPLSPSEQVIAFLSDQIESLDDEEASIANIQLKTIIELVSLANEIKSTSEEHFEEINEEIERLCVQLLESLNIEHDEDSVKKLVAHLLGKPVESEEIISARDLNIWYEPMREVAAGRPTGPLWGFLENTLSGHVRLGSLALTARL